MRSKCTNIIKPSKECYPREYYSTNNGEYKKFIKKFIDEINKLQENVYELKTSVGCSLTVFALDIRNGKLPAQSIKDNAEEIKYLESRIEILKNTITRSNEGNFKRNCDAALREMSIKQHSCRNLLFK